MTHIYIYIAQSCQSFCMVEWLPGALFFRYFWVRLSQRVAIHRQSPTGFDRFNAVKVKDGFMQKELNAFGQIPIFSCHEPKWLWDSVRTYLCILIYVEDSTCTRYYIRLCLDIYFVCLSTPCDARFASCWLNCLSVMERSQSSLWSWRWLWFRWPQEIIKRERERERAFQRLDLQDILGYNFILYTLNLFIYCIYRRFKKCPRPWET